VNLIPLAALLLSCLAVAISVAAVFAVRAERRAPRRGTDTLFRDRPNVTTGSIVMPEVNLPEDWEPPRTHGRRRATTEMIPVVEK
jgi:hypothetical protein